MKGITKKLAAISLAAIACFSAAGCGEALSAYDIAVKNGFTGTEAEWLASLKGESGENGKDGKNAAITAGDLYDEAVKRGYTGSYLDFIEKYFGGNLSGDYSNVINECVNQVVRVKSTFPVYSGYGKTTEETAGGAGVFYKVNREAGDAYVITNYHVVYNADSLTADKIASKIELYLYGKEGTYSQASGNSKVEYSYAVTAEYIGGSLNYDIAVLKVTNSDVIKYSNATAVNFSTETEVKVGTTAIAIGNPGGGGIAASLGIVSKDSEYITMTAADEKTSVTFRCMRVDCAVNPGNSGGGLFNGNGELTGIVNAKVVESTMENIGYAIPVSNAKAVAENILWQYETQGKTGVYPQKALMGITLVISDSSAVYDEVEKNTRIVETVSVADVTSSSAQKVFKVNDVVKTLTIGGKTIEVNRMYQMVDAMLTARIGDKVKMTVLRDGGLVELEYTLTSDNFTEIK